MEIKTNNKVEFADGQSQTSRDSNGGSFEWTVIGDSTPMVVSEDNLAPLDFKIDNVNKYSFELKPGNNFDVLLKQDIVRCDSINNITSIDIFCFESTTIRPYRIPIRFDIFLEDVDFSLGKMSQFSLNNIKQLSSDVRINNIQVPLESKATLVIIVSTKD